MSQEDLWFHEDQDDQEDRDLIHCTSTFYLPREVSHTRTQGYPSLYDDEDPFDTRVPRSESLPPS